MTIDLTDTAFWSGYADAQKFANDFTTIYARAAWAQAAVPAGARVIDIACGAGALALVAAAAGADVLATDFAPGMVDSVSGHQLPNVRAAVMDGQALDLPDGGVEAGFDAAFSLFGIMLFPDWRAGLAEMARVLRRGGTGCIGTWADPSGAAANLLLARLTAALYPEYAFAAPVTGLAALGDPARLEAEMRRVGFDDVRIERVSADFPIDAAMVAEPDRLFQFSLIWPELGDARQALILSTIAAAIDARGGSLPVPSPALIATARKL